MFKVLDQLYYNHWEKMRLKNAWWFLVVMGEIVAIEVGPLYIFYMIVPYIAQIPYFSGHDRFDMAFAIWIGYAVLILCIMGAWIFHDQRRRKKSKREKTTLKF